MAADFLTPGLDGNITEANASAVNARIDAIETASSDALPAASFTDAAVTSKVLTGLAAGSASAIGATDTILEALAKLQAQIDAI